jgi:hypothetical protein
MANAVSTTKPFQTRKHPERQGRSQKKVFTTKVTKSTKLRILKISMSETFVAGARPEHSRRVCFVVESLFTIFPRGKPD